MNIVNPWEITHEERVGIKPHSSIIIENKEAMQIWKCLRRDIFYLVLEEVKLLSVFRTDVFKYAFIIEYCELPSTDARVVPHIVHAKPCKCWRVLRIRVPVNPKFFWENWL